MAEVSSNPGGQTGKKTKVRAKRMSTRIDMTPMVDLAFLLLTFFMLTTTLMDPYVIDVKMPKDDEKGDPTPVNERRVLTLVLGEKNQIYWYTGMKDPELHTTNYSSKGITDVLIQKKSEIKKMIVLIKPSQDAVYQNMVDIIDEMNILEIQYYFVKITDTDKALVNEHRQQSLTMNSH